MAGESSGSGTARALIAELFGTFALTFVAAGASVVAAVSGGEVNEVARAASGGLIVLAMIYAIGDISGAHINPAVTLAFALRGDFPWRKVPAYWVSQIAGALLAAGLLRVMFGAVAGAGVSSAHHGPWVALGMESVLTAFLISVILGTATRARILGPQAGIPVGAIIILAGLFAGPVSDASLNPARSLGPALVEGELHGLWIYLAAPALGALAAVGLVWLMKGAPNRSESTTAKGERQARSKREAEGARRER